MIPKSQGQLLSCTEPFVLLRLPVKALCAKRSWMQPVGSGRIAYLAFTLGVSIGSFVAAQVEDEMRELLSVMEQQKVASAAKVKQLATILQDMQASGMQ